MPESVVVIGGGPISDLWWLGSLTCELGNRRKAKSYATDVLQNPGWGHEKQMGAQPRVLHTSITPPMEKRFKYVSE